MMKWLAIFGLFIVVIGCGSAQQVAVTQIPTNTIIQATEMPPITEVPTEIPATPEPAATETPEQRYVSLAQTAARPSTRQALGLPAGEWKAEIMNVGDGPEVTLTAPLQPGMSSEQTVRQAQRQLSAIVKALFEGDSELVRVIAIGTLPDAADQSELQAVSIFVMRDNFNKWDGTTEGLGEWRIAPRYK